MKLKISFAVLILCSLVTGQGTNGFYIPARTVFGTVNGITRPIGSATVTVCAPATGGIPCAPPLANTVFKDSALQVPSSNPFTTDQNGNYPQVALAAGTYTITESAPGYAGYSYQITVPFTVLPTFALNNLSGGTAPSGQTYNFNGDSIIGVGLLNVNGGSTASWFSTAKTERNCMQDNIVCDGGNASPTNNLTAINNCLANAYANGQNPRFPGCQMAYTGTVNDTNMPGMTIVGTQATQGWGNNIAGASWGTVQTQFIANSGGAGSGIAWDATGSGFQFWRDFTICSAPNVGCQGAYSIPSPAKVGILFARDNAVSNGSSTGTGTYCFPSAVTMQNVYVIMDHNAAATARGTVAIVDLGGEGFALIGGKFASDYPVFYDNTNSLSLTSPYQTIASGAACPASMTEVTMANTVSLQSWQGSAMEIRNGVDFWVSPATEMLNACTAATGGNCSAINHSPCILLDGGNSGNISLGGQCESFDFAMGINGVTIDRLYATISLNQAVAGILQFAGTPTINNSLISIKQVNGTPQPLINAGSSAATITNTNIYEGSLSGTGALGSGVTYTGGTLYAQGITDTNALTFNSSSQFQICGATGQCGYVNGSRFVEGAMPSGITGNTVIGSDSGDHMWKFNPNNTGKQHVPQLYTLTAQYTNSTTGFTTVGTPNIAFPVNANENYTATCHLFYQAAATGGLNIQFTGPASPTAVIYGLNDPSAATTFNDSVATAFSTSLGQVVGTATTNFDAIVSLSLINGANAGTVTLQAKSSAAVQLAIQGGSYCRVQ